MAKTKDAIKILKKRFQKDSELEKFYEEEKINLQAAQAIREAREKEGLSQKQLADMIGTTQSVISRLEDANYEGHSLSMLQRIAKALKRRWSLHMETIEAGARST